MFKIIVPSEKVKEELIEESRYLHNHNGLDSNFASTLMHLYLLPDEFWVIQNDKKQSNPSIGEKP